MRTPIKNTYAYANAKRKEQKIKNAKNPFIQRIYKVIGNHCENATLMPCNRGYVLALGGKKGPAQFLNKIISLMALTDNERGWAYHNDYYFCQELCVSRSTVGRYKALLKGLGVLEYTYARRQKCTYYRVDPGALENRLKAYGIKTGKEEAEFVKAPKPATFKTKKDASKCGVEYNREVLKTDLLNSPSENGEAIPPSEEEETDPDQIPGEARSADPVIEAVSDKHGRLDRQKCLEAIVTNPVAVALIALFPPSVSWTEQTARSFFHRWRQGWMKAEFVEYLKIQRSIHPGLFMDPKNFLSKFRFNYMWDAYLEFVGKGYSEAEQVYEQAVAEPTDTQIAAELARKVDPDSDEDFPELSSAQLVTAYAKKYPLRFGALALATGNDRHAADAIRWHNFNLLPDRCRAWEAAEQAKAAADSSYQPRPYSARLDKDLKGLLKPETDRFRFPAGAQEDLWQTQKVVKEFAVTHLWFLDRLHTVADYWELDVAELKKEAAKRLAGMKLKLKAFGHTFE